MRKTLVKSKIVLENNGTVLVLYLWKKTFWLFGYWYAHGSAGWFSKIPDKRIQRINNEETQEVLFEKFIRGLE